MIQRKPGERVEVAVHLRVHARRRPCREGAGEAGAEVAPGLIAGHDRQLPSVDVVVGECQRVGEPRAEDVQIVQHEAPVRVLDGREESGKVAGGFRPVVEVVEQPSRQPIRRAQMVIRLDDHLVVLQRLLARESQQAPGTVRPRHERLEEPL